MTVWGALVMIIMVVVSSWTWYRRGLQLGRYDLASAIYEREHGVLVSCCYQCGVQRGMTWRPVSCDGVSECFFCNRREITWTVDFRQVVGR